MIAGRNLPDPGAPRMSTVQLSLLYGLFGVISIASNLIAQSLIHWIWPLSAGELDLAYFTALAFGTGVGLVVKFLLDKIWIFEDFEADGAAQHGAQFLRYAAMGLVTTGIFWGAQSGAFALWRSETALLIGGAAGLTLGYVVKYQLDRRFVFNRGKGA